MIRSIERFHRDEDGDWVAELSCLHNQHVRHRPPFFDRSWVLTDEGRVDHIGASIDCPLCDRAELPRDLRSVRTAGPFDAASLPRALCTAHVVADHTWAVVRVIEGSIGFTMATDPPIQRTLNAPETQSVPPGVEHAVAVDGPMRMTIEFMVRSPQ